MSPKKTMHKYFEMEVSLIGPTPKIWRRFLIHKYSTFDHLHKAIQAACGWQDYHLYSFSDENPYNSYFGDNLTFAISPHDLAENYQPEPEYAENLRLGHIFSDKSIGREIFYLYDYGDGWIHSVKMTGIHKFGEKFRRKLLAGERAFPIEDSGSLPGYQRCIEAYRDPKNAEEDLLVWMGDWNPEHFDLKRTQAMFESTRKKSADLGMSVEEAIELDEPQNKAVHNNVIDLQAKLASNRKKKNS